MEQKGDSELKAEDIPPPRADWGDINRFALTYPGPDTTLRNYYGFYKGDFVRQRYKETGSFDDFFLRELRGALFEIQRAVRWSGEAPEGDELSYIHALVESIRSKVLSGKLGPSTDPRAGELSLK